ncbi:MAG: aldehyde dehydrogenase (NADP(+)) [Gemmatimonadota bacterium]|nr:aldehyde dehydrogenase (NADP(+)) [Gemmatimonadota bacterium]
MNITGENLIGGAVSAEGGIRFRGVDPRTHAEVEPSFTEATTAEVDRAAVGSRMAFEMYSRSPASVRAAFLRAIADELIALDAELIDRAHLETALPIGRLEGERGRTVGQLRLFAALLDEGSWVDARIDRGDPARTPAPRPDLRRMLVPLGPVAVFGASNFPFAFSVPGGDTASALASGCTVVCKGHPAHPGTSELAARAIDRAAISCGIDRGVFSLLHGWSHEVGLAMVRHPAIAAVGFTGSLRGGRALFDAAAARRDPIPVYAEMGSVNPVFLLPSAVKERGAAIAQGLATSITLGTGQFCTNPGIIAGVRDAAFDSLETALAARISAADASVMLYPQLFTSYGDAVARAEGHGATVLARSVTDDARRATPALLRLDASQFVEQGELREEMFGPVSVVVGAGDIAELERVAESLEGQLTATIHGTPAELRENHRLVAILQRKVGRLLFNGYPTGVEVGHAMQHGGPYPASTDARSTSVGSAAIDRFVRPLCYQDFPDDCLPVALRDSNAHGIWRLVDGARTREPIR